MEGPGSPLPTFSDSSDYSTAPTSPCWTPSPRTTDPSVTTLTSDNIIYDANPNEFSFEINFQDGHVINFGPPQPPPEPLGPVISSAGDLFRNAGGWPLRPPPLQLDFSSHNSPSFTSPRDLDNVSISQNSSIALDRQDSGSSLFQRPRATRPSEMLGHKDVDTNEACKRIPVPSHGFLEPNRINWRSESDRLSGKSNQHEMMEKRDLFRSGSVGRADPQQTFPDQSKTKPRPNNGKTPCSKLTDQALGIAFNNVNNQDSPRWRRTRMAYKHGGFFGGCFGLSSSSSRK